MDKKKHKKPKKPPTAHQAMTGFEKAFEQFATSTVIDTKDAGAVPVSPLSLMQGDVPSESKLDVSCTSYREESTLESSAFGLTHLCLYLMT